MELFVPGRICLLGEHSDWAGSYRRQNANIEKGYTIIMGTNQGLYARISLNPKKLVLRSVLSDGSEKRKEIKMAQEDLLKEAQAGGFFSYAAGVTYQILKNWKVGGLEIDNYRMDLPVKKGLSSSAALCVLIARAFNRFYDLHLTVQGEMDLAYRGEIITPSRCGRMDQGCAYGNRPILMTFDQDIVEVDEIRPRGAFYLLIVDLKGEKDTVKILADLNRSYPFPRNDRDKKVQEYLGPVNKEIVEQAAGYLVSGDAPALGRLMTRAQELFDEYLLPSSPDELMAPLLHRLLKYPAIQPGIFGGKGVGSQGDGTAQLLCKGADERDRVSSIIEKEFGMTCLPLDIKQSEDIKKALIPAAGFGSDLFPAAKVAQKELFPVVDRNGVAKPVLLANLEEVKECGLEEVVIVVRPEDRGMLRSFFEDELSPEKMNRLPDSLKRYNKKIEGMGYRVRFVEQEVSSGFGHAVYLSRKEMGEEPFLLLLGDFLYCTGEKTSCAEQLIDVFYKTQRSVVGVKRITEDQLTAYGVVGGTWIKEKELLEITEIVEKPNVQYARERLKIPGLPAGEYLGLFGLYVLQAEIFEDLETVISQGLDIAGQFELTTGLELLRKHTGCLAYLVNGESFDIGTPDSYLSALKAFRTSGGNNRNQGE